MSVNDSSIKLAESRFTVLTCSMVWLYARDSAFFPLLQFELAPLARRLIDAAQNLHDLDAVLNRA